MPEPEQEKRSQPPVAHELSRESQVINSLVEKTIGTELPEYFRYGGDYAKFQFAVGWTKRNTESGRLEGAIASHLTHPDIGQDFDKLPQGVKNFVQAMSTYHVLVYSRLSPRELIELRDAGKQDFSHGIAVQDPLLSKVNEIHHLAWMSARDIARLGGLDMTIRDHKTHKERSLLSPEEIAADNAQVQAYAVQLALMDQTHFDWLVARTRG